MATREQLYSALQKADAAGDVEAARRIARMLAGDASPTPEQPPVDYAAKEAASMPWHEALAVGVGRGFNDVGQGLKQIALNSFSIPGTASSNFANVIPGLRDKVNQMSADQKRQQENELRDYKKLADAQPWPAGLGRFAGNVAAAPVPAAQAESLLGRMAVGALAGGAASGAQYVPEGGSRLQNMAVGAAVGGALPAVFQGVKLTIGNVQELAKKLKDAMPNVSQAARERAAAQMIREATANPANLAKAGQQPQFIPGTRQTLAEATNDPGIAGMQRTLASMSPQFNSELSNLAQANNTARVEAIRAGFGGADEASAQAIEAARNKLTAPLLAQARKVKGVDIKPVVTLTNRILKSRQGNDSVTTVIGRVKSILEREGMDNVQTLHNVRQEIGNILSGQSSNEAAGKAATRELMAIREALDNQIGKASPQFRQFLKQYAEMSRQAGQVRVGDELLGKSMAAADSLGNPVLSPAKIAGASKNLDQVARAATGFRKETAQRLMTPQQQALVGNLRADLDRYARAQRDGIAVGSNSLQNASGMGRVQDAALGGQMTAPLLPSSLTGPLSILNSVRQHYGNKTLEIVQQMMLNPNQAQRILTQYPAAQRQQVMNLLSRPEFQQLMNSAAARVPASAGALAAPNAQEPGQ